MKRVSVQLYVAGFNVRVLGGLQVEDFSVQVGHENLGVYRALSFNLGLQRIGWVGCQCLDIEWLVIPCLSMNPPA